MQRQIVSGYLVNLCRLTISFRSKGKQSAVCMSLGTFRFYREQKTLRNQINSTEIFSKEQMDLLLILLTVVFALTVGPAVISMFLIGLATLFGGLLYVGAVMLSPFISLFSRTGAK